MKRSIGRWSGFSALAVFAIFAGTVLNSQEVKNHARTHTIEAGGMTVQLRYLDDSLDCLITAPTAGWVAIGFNSRSGLTGTNLIMAAVLPDGSVQISDRYVFGPGDHRAISDSSDTKTSSAAPRLVSGIEERRDSGHITRIRFRVPVVPRDRYHHDLRQQEFYLLMAYSQADEFDHHSTMRTERKIQHSGGGPPSFSHK